MKEYDEVRTPSSRSVDQSSMPTTTNIQDDFEDDVEDMTAVHSREAGVTFAQSDASSSARPRSAALRGGQSAAADDDDVSPVHSSSSSTTASVTDDDDVPPPPFKRQQSTTSGILREGDTHRAERIAIMKQRKVSFADEDGAQLEHVQEIHAVSATNSSFASQSSEATERTAIHANLSISDVDDDDDDDVADHVGYGEADDVDDEVPAVADDAMVDSAEGDLDEWGFRRDLSEEIDRRVLASKSTSSSMGSGISSAGGSTQQYVAQQGNAQQGSVQQGNAQQGRAQQAAFPPTASDQPACSTHPAAPRGNPRQWNSQQVAAWLADIGMEQHGPAFMRHGVDGAALLAADEARLQNELGVVHVSHRLGILEARHRLCAQHGIHSGRSEHHDSHPRKPRTTASPPCASGRGRSQRGSPSTSRQSSPGPRPGLGRRALLDPATEARMQDTRRSLQAHLQEARQQADEQRRAAAAAQQRVSSAGRQLAHLRHQLEHLDHMLGRQRPRAESCLAGRAKGCGVYRDGTSAWYPAGRVVYDAEDYSLYDDVNEACFHPYVSERSRQLVAAGEGAKAAPADAFLQRMTADLARRKARTKRAAGVVTSTSAADQRKRNCQTVRFAVEAAVGKDAWAALLSRCEGREEAAAAAAGTEHADCLGLTEAEVAAVAARSTAAARVALVAASLRTRAFMERYAGDVASRDARLQRIRARWEQQQGLVKDTKALEAFEVQQLIRELTKCGWAADVDQGDAEAVATPERVAALLARAREAQAARVNGTAVDWSKDVFRYALRSACPPPSLPLPHSKDGLEALQAAHDAKQQRPETAPKANTTRRRAQSAAPASEQASQAPQPVRSQPHLAYLVTLLASCEAATLASIQQASGTQQLRLLYRALRASRFLSAMEEDMRQRERNLEEMVARSFQPQRRVLTEEEAEGFLQRLLADAAKRQAKRCAV